MKRIKNVESKRDKLKSRLRIMLGIIWARRKSSIIIRLLIQIKMQNNNLRAYWAPAKPQKSLSNRTNRIPSSRSCLGRQCRNFRKSNNKPGLPNKMRSDKNSRRSEYNSKFSKFRRLRQFPNKNKFLRRRRMSLPLNEFKKII